ncbi:MAG: hypothetical protein Q7S08_01110 [bacterium]|nr:hypothetical protein [bacterium]
MIFFYSGNDTKKAREEMGKEIARLSEGGARTVRITDVNTVADLQASLQGGGLFGEKHIVIFDSVSLNDEMREVFFQSLEMIQTSEEPFFIFEESPLADIRRLIEKHAEKKYRYDAPKKKKDDSVFALANALRRADKKALWSGYQRELIKGNAPEAIHGVLFWGAKDMLLKSMEGTPENRRAKKLVAELAELPHKARRNNFPLEYALERFMLSVA